MLKAGLKEVESTKHVSDIMSDNPPQKSGESNDRTDRRCQIEIYYNKDENGNKKLTSKIIEDKSDIFQRLTGTPNKDLAQSIIDISVRSLPGGWDNVDNVNMILQSLADLKPNDSNEARLITQAAVLYSKGMKYSKMAESALDRHQDADLFEKAGLIEAHQIQTKFALKFFKLHAETIEALGRLRRGNEQRILVQHVQINGGGRAVIAGQMIAGGGGNNENS